MTNAYLIKKEVLPKITNAYSVDQTDYDMAFCKKLREIVRYNAAYNMFLC